jgi:A/G-specific adenine glycosylase
MPRIKKFNEDEVVLRPEHRIIFTSRDRLSSTIDTRPLKKFFVWYAKEDLRDFPWRQPHVSPLHLLLAELLLVQTKAEDVARVWPTIIHRYPCAADLSKARKADLIRLLKPLGLQNQRAARLKALGKVVARDLDGQLPTTLAGLLSLPHVGLYAATAVACFKFGMAVPIVDANVIRVLGRIAGFEGGKELRRRPDIWALAWHILPKRTAALHNYGLLDFAARVCCPQRPHCSMCPLSSHCAFARRRSCSTSEGCAAESK